MPDSNKTTGTISKTPWALIGGGMAILVFALVWRVSVSLKYE
jgi:hypothetical protein